MQAISQKIWTYESQREANLLYVHTSTCAFFFEGNFQAFFVPAIIIALLATETVDEGLQL